MCIFWPGITKDIINMIEHCEVCQKYQDKQPREQITTPPIPSSPWHTIASDLFEFQGKTYLITSDRYTKFVVVRELVDHSAEQTIKVFRSIFCENDRPKVLVTDRGRNYTSSAFTAFCHELDIKHIYNLSIPPSKPIQLREPLEPLNKSCGSVSKLETHGI